MTGQSIGRRTAGHVSALAAVLVLVAGCATPSTEIEWETGGAMSERQSASSTPQIAQQSIGIDGVFGVEGAEDELDDYDPLEIPNRFIFAFNRALDTFILQPAAATYRFLLPELVRDSVRNVLRNLQTPVILANDLLQGEWERAETTAVRFAINSTAGVLGLIDIAEGQGYEYHNEDFGQTLGSYGIGEGVYLVLPVFGPSSARDGIGIVVDIFLDPLTYVASEYDLEKEFLIRPVVNGIDTRSRNIETLDDLRRDSIDFYARIRSLWRQNRRNEIRNGRDDDAASVPDLYDFDFDTEQANEPVNSAQPL